MRTRQPKATRTDTRFPGTSVLRFLSFNRALGLGMDRRARADSCDLIVDQVDAAELSPGEFSQRVRNCVERHGVRTVVIDSLNGYQSAMPEENALVLHMHELLQYLNRQGATTFLTVAQHGLVGDMKTPVELGRASCRERVGQYV